jgi:hypothetical protein
MSAESRGTATRASSKARGKRAKKKSHAVNSPHKDL